MNCFTKKVGYSGLNTARSALSLVLGPIDGLPVGQHPLIIRLMKGVWRNRPPKRKYNSVWDATLILSLFKRWDENCDLSLHLLSLKLIALMALVTGQRVQTLSKIKVSKINVTSKGKEIFIEDMIKTSGVGRYQPTLSLFSYDKNKKICVVRCLDEYLSRTSVL